METKGVTCKIPLDLHQRASEEIREKGMTVSQYIELIILEHMNGVNTMAKGRTLAFKLARTSTSGSKNTWHAAKSCIIEEVHPARIRAGTREKALKEAGGDVRPQRAPGALSQRVETTPSGEEPTHVGAQWPPSGELTE